jgi:heme-degrading monooxygenase HmoA
MAHIVSYSHITLATVPSEVWDECWFTLQSWKGYLQSFPGYLGMHLAARALEDGDVRVHSATVWEHPEQLEAWRESEWSVSGAQRAVRQARPHRNINGSLCITFGHGH